MFSSWLFVRRRPRLDYQCIMRAEDCNLILVVSTDLVGLATPG